MANHKGRKENLKPFKKDDQRINRKGRPLKLPELDALMADVLGSMDRNGITNAQRILKKMIEKATKGDVHAFEALFNRAFGKPHQSMDVTTQGKVLNHIITQIEIIKTVKNDSAESAGDQDQGINQSGISSEEV